MIDISFEPVAHAPGVFTSEPLASGRGDRIRATVHGRAALMTAECDAKGKTPGLPWTAGPGFDSRIEPGAREVGCPPGSAERLKRLGVPSWPPDPEPLSRWEVGRARLAGRLLG